MPVLIEAISVVVRRDSINQKLVGGWSAFLAGIPNNTLCFDPEIVRIGFMSPEDVHSYIDDLESQGLRYLVGDCAKDIAVIDQRKGFMVRTNWLEIETMHIDEFDGTVVVCKLCGSKAEGLVTPGRWKFAGSPSQRAGFTPLGNIKKDIQFLRTDEGIDVFLDLSSGEEVYVGPTSRRH